MKTKKTNDEKVFMGLVEMNESQKKDVTGGVIEGGILDPFKPRDIFTPCCGMIISVEPPVWI